MPSTFITNNVPRLILDGLELTTGERAEFDYIDWQAVERGEAVVEFVRYRGDLIDLGVVEVAPCTYKAKGYDGVMVTSAFSALAFRYFDRDGYEYGDAVVIARVQW